MSLPKIIEPCAARIGADERAIYEAESALGRPIPDDYKSVLRLSDGLEGFISANVYVFFWSVAELASLNEGYGVAEFVPGVTLLGSDGGDTGYGFRMHDSELQYIAVPLIGMEPSAIEVLGRSFVDLIEYLAK